MPIVFKPMRFEINGVNIVNILPFTWHFTVDYGKTEYDQYYEDLDNGGLV